MYVKAKRIFSKGYLPISLLPLSKLHGILSEIKEVLLIKNKNYDLVLLHLYFYFDMKLVTFGIDKKETDNLVPSVCMTLYTETANIVSN